jgi:hypothetical protein
MSARAKVGRRLKGEHAFTVLCSVYVHLDAPPVPEKGEVTRRNAIDDVAYAALARLNCLPSDIDVEIRNIYDDDEDMLVWED